VAKVAVASVAVAAGVANRVIVRNVRKMAKPRAMLLRKAPNKMMQQKHRHLKSRSQRRAVAAEADAAVTVARPKRV
jgi:hypothetical protein